MDFELDITSGFQVAVYPAGATFGPRLLRDYELVWMIEGDAEYRKDGAVFHAPQGSIILCQPDTRDFFRWDTRHRTRHGWFHFHIRGEVPVEWNRAESWVTVRLPQSENELLITLFRRLVAGGPNQSGITISTASRLLAAALLAEFITEPVINHSRLENRLYPDAVTRAMAFIAMRLEQQPSPPLPLDQIAAAACVSAEHLCRLFKMHTGHSPGETVRLMRLDRAVVLLARSNYAVGEIALLCGFPSQFHFARRFKEVFGQTPSDLRRDITNGRRAIPLSPLLRFTGTLPPPVSASSPIRK